MSATSVESELVFLFTDIEGSTRVWEDQGAAMSVALERHNTLIAAAIANHGGRIFKMMGDSVFAVFSDPRSALESALAAQRALLETDWRSFGLAQDLAVRMALHAGLVQARDGDYTGAPLNRIARLLAAGHGSQILLFATMAERIAELPAEVSFRDLGERRLRDLPGTERILQVIAPGLPASFPPLRALDPAPHNLPTLPTPCIDRESELDLLRAYLLQATTWLVTLTGSGGIGKTRLALKAAFDLLDSYPDGVWFVDLSAVREDEQVVSVVIRELKIPEHTGQQLETLVVAWLRERRLLLVLDNCEQVVAGAARLVAAIHQGAPETQVLATSRAPLGIRGEQQLPVEPLSLPAARAVPDMLEVASSPSVQLFVARATEARPIFALTPDNMGAVAAICQQVEGIPLALELAAARVSILSPEALQQRLTYRLPMLTSGSRDLPARQQTLRNAIDWSHELLSDNERILFRRLSVFAGGATLGAIEGFLGADSTIPLLETLAALVNQNLLRVDPLAPDGPRFSMLETIREFASEALEDAQETETWRDAHAGYFLALSHEAAPHLEGGARQQEWMGRIDREYQNLRSAALWWLDRQEAAHVLELCSNIWHYWSVRGGAREGSDLIRRALMAADDISPLLRAGALRKFGNLSIAIGDTRMAKTLYEESLAIERAERNMLGIANSLSDLGFVAMMQGRESDYLPLLIESRRIFKEIGEVRGEAVTLFCEATGARNSGDLDRAEELLMRVLPIQEALSDDLGISWSWYSLSKIARDRGNLDRAFSLSTQALKFFRSVQDEEAAACASEVIASVELARGNVNRSRQLLRSALETHQQRHDMQKMAECLEGLAAVAFRAADLSAASESLSSATHLRDQSGCPVPRIDGPALEQLEQMLASD